MKRAHGAFNSWITFLVYPHATKFSALGFSADIARGVFSLRGVHRVPGVRKGETPSQTAQEQESICVSFYSFIAILGSTPLPGSSQSTAIFCINFKRKKTNLVLARFRDF